MAATNTPSGVAVGAIAGGISTTVFTGLHHILINPIWWMLPIMLVAGAASGACLAWCYSRLAAQRTRRSWWRYVALFTTMFGLLALTSGLVYEPIITMTELLNSTGGNPIPISESIGLMIVFTLLWSAFLTLLYRRGWRVFGVALATTTVVMLFLGINVATIGLVELQTGAWVLMAEFFGYIAALGGVYGITYSTLTRWPDQQQANDFTPPSRQRTP